MNRAGMLALSAAAIGGAALPARAQSNDTIRVGLVPSEDGALAYYAQQKGFFKAAGLNVELTFMPNGGAVSAGILGNSFDIGTTNSGSIAAAYLKGLPLQMLACGAVYSPASPISHLVVAKTSSIRSAKDLSGKTFAVTTLHDMLQASVLAWIDKNGGDWKTVNFLELTGSQMASAIAAKRIDGSALIEPYFTSAKSDLYDLGSNFDAINNGKAVQIFGIATTKDWFAKNSAAGQKVASAIHATAKWANDPKNHAECAALLAAHSKIDPAVIAAYPRLTFAEANNPGLIQPVIDMLAKYTFIDHSFAAKDLFAPGVA